DQHDPARAVSLYRGPFLDGFYLNGEGDFGRWVEGERARLAKLMSDALQSLACAARERGEHRTAADWWRRPAEPDPLRSRDAPGPAAPRAPRRGAGVTAAKLALGAALLTGIGAALVARPDRHVRLDPDLVAVAPFDVLPPQLALWREGLVDVLSRGLDRAGPLR